MQAQSGEQLEQEIGREREADKSTPYLAARRLASWTPIGVISATPNDDSSISPGPASERFHVDAKPRPTSSTRHAP